MKISIWLFTCCFMVFMMVVIGGVTRLTESGLSITEWKPVTGTIPPLSEIEWQAEFEKYQQIPEYKEKNFGMDLAEFKNIYVVEYAHRLIGRLAGFIFLIPFVYFLATGRIRGIYALKLFGIFALGGVQGAIGWYMVKSGLSERTDVSQYRLALHLSIAVIIYALLFWQALKMLPVKLRVNKKNNLRSFSKILTLMVFLQMVTGAFVAGLDAGKVYNTFPLMDGDIIPAGLFTMSPLFVNFFENVTTVQFNHRLLAYITSVAIIYFWSLGKDSDLKGIFKISCNLLLVVLVIQFTLGVATLVGVVPLVIASLHQAFAVILFSVSLFINYQLCDIDGPTKK